MAGAARSTSIAHSLPLGIDQVALRGLAVGRARVDVVFQRVGEHVVAFTEGRGCGRGAAADARSD